MQLFDLKYRLPSITVYVSGYKETNVFIPVNGLPNELLQCFSESKITLDNYALSDILIKN
jgi:hypothetical protein